MTHNEALKPCPFCGSNGMVMGLVGQQKFIICTRCHAETAYYTEQRDAIIAWNTRTTDRNKPRAA